MDDYLKDLMERNTPKFNQDIVNGLATKHIPQGEAYIDQIFRSAAKSLPPGLVYHGCERCSPQEEYREVTRVKNNKRLIDIARSDLYLMKYYLSFNGEPLPPKYLYLPFVGEGSTIYLGGSRFLMSPVMTDKVFSPNQTEVFLRLLRDKIVFKRIYHPILINGERESHQVVYANLYRTPTNDKKIKPSTKSEKSLVHYLLAKYGFTEMFRKFTGYVPIVGESEITEETHPKDKYTIFSSNRIKPRTFITGIYEPSNLKVVVENDKLTPFIQSLIVGFFYLVDHFPSRFRASFVNETHFYKILLGEIIFSNSYNEGTLFDNIQKHFNSLNDNVDIIMKEKLKLIGFEVEDFYELLAVVVSNFKDWLINGADSTNSMYNKELMILYFIFYPITEAIFSTQFKLTKLSARKELTKKEIIEVLNKNIKMGLIFKITKKHVNMSTVSYSGDNKFLKMTNIINPQTASNDIVRKNKSRNIADPSKKLDISISDSGSHLGLPKSSPQGNARVNPYITVDTETNTILPNPKYVDLLGSAKEKLKRYKTDTQATVIEEDIELDND